MADAGVTVGNIDPAMRPALALLLRTLDHHATMKAGARLVELPIEARQRLVDELKRTRLGEWLVRAAGFALKAAQAEHARGALGILPIATAAAEPGAGRGRENVVDAESLPVGETLEADVVVVGTGAGGAPVARSLAARGHAVLMLEAGGPHGRSEFTGRGFDMQRLLYWRAGSSFAWGSSLIPVPLGQGVGGTTTINSGTCFRTPDRVLARWRDEDGLVDLGPGKLDAYFERVEKRLEVAPADAKYLGECAAVIARGAEALGYEHAPLLRNAPGCDGQGVCCFGCPTGAKRSTDVAYIPDALDFGATLVHHARVVDLRTEGNRVLGVIAESTGQRKIRLVVHAKVVVLAAGAVHTPALLLRTGLCNDSGAVGHGLTIHPAGHAWAELDRPVEAWRSIPQGYGVHSFSEEGIRFEGAFLPLELAAAAFRADGRAWAHLVDNFDRLASFGFMITDSSSGRVVVGRDGSPRMLYSLTREDVRRIARAHAILARIFLAGGAQVVHPTVRGFEELRRPDDARRLEEAGVAKLAAADLDISAYHPLGTCRMGARADRHVVAPTHETYQVENLFICDGSTVNGPLGVNPQITILALAERAAELIARRVEELERRVLFVSRRSKHLIEFDERMRGTLELGERSRATEFRVSVRLVERAGTTTRWELSGSLDIEGLAVRAPCRGTLEIRPETRAEWIRYDLRSLSTDGRELRLTGHKSLDPRHPIQSLTVMTTQLSEATRDVIGKGTLLFPLRDVLRWLRSFRVALRD